MPAVGFTEFDEIGKKLGVSMGRLYRPSLAHAGSYVFALTDENQESINVDTNPGTPGSISVYQTVDVTTLMAIDIWFRWKPSSDQDWRLLVLLQAFTVWDETISVGDAERGWYRITVPCSKIVGNQVLQVAAVVV